MHSTRRQVLSVAAGASAVVALGGCEKLVSRIARSGDEGVPAVIHPPTGVAIDPIHHLLNRAGFGPWPGEVEKARAAGAEHWIDRQLHPQTINDELCELRARRCDGLDGPPGENHDLPKHLLRESMARRTLLRAVYSKRQLYEQMVAFWTDHLNINIEKGDCIYLKAWDDEHVIRKHALGKFRDLIHASAVSPAMLVYLDGSQNNAKKPNENYGRELLELHTLGVHGGYSQRDVKEAARALTGWRVRGGLFKPAVHFEATEHDQGVKTLLGQIIPARQNEKDLESVVNIVCRHPATALHIATKLCKRFIAEEPPESVVEKVAGVFRNTDGDIKEMVRAVLMSEEFRASAGAKFKPPFRFVASALRAVGADTHAHTPLIEYLTRMGEGVFQYPTPDGYPDKTSPWLGTLLWRWNLAFNLSSNKVPSVDAPVVELAAALGATGDDAAARLYEHFTGRAPTDDQRSALNAARDIKPTNLDAVKQLIGLILASPGFQRC